MKAARLLTLALAINAPFILATGGHAEMTPHSYVGMWVTADGYVRHNLLPDNRYDEARGTRESAYRGRYQVTADGVFVDDNTLHHGGMILYRRR